MKDNEFRERFLTETEGWGARRGDRSRIMGVYIRDKRTSAADLEAAKAELSDTLDTSLDRSDVVEAARDVMDIIPRNPTAEHILLEKIRWWVEDTREHVWGEREPPYKDIEEAREWLEGVWSYRQREDLSPEQSSRADELYSTIDDALEELGELEDAAYDYGYAIPQMLCWVPAEERSPTRWTLEGLVEEERDLLGARLFTKEVRPIGLGRGPSPYHWLARELDRNVEATGFSLPDVLDHLLTGRRPRLPPVTVGLRGRSLGRAGERNDHTYLTIRVNTRMKNEDVKKLGNRLRTLWDGGPDDKRQQDRQERELLKLAYEAIARRDGPPPKKGRDYSGFWTEVARWLEHKGYTGSLKPHALATRFYPRSYQERVT